MGPSLTCGNEARSAPARRAAAARRAAQLRRDLGDVAAIGLWGPPSLAWVAALEAVTWAGATAVLLPPHADEALLAGPGAAHLPVICTAPPPPALARRALPEAALPTPLGDPPAQPAAAAAADAALPEPLWSAEAPFLRVFTSGTTAAPRPVDLTLGQLLAGAFGSAMRLGHLPTDRWLCCLPLHHVGGVSILLRAMWGGTDVLLMPRFDAAAVAAALDGGTVQLCSLVPTMLAAVLDARPAVPFPAALRAILLGGAAAPAALLARAAALGVPVAQSWGMSETAAQVATAAPSRDLQPGCVGPPLALAQVWAAPDGTLTVTGAQVTSPLATADRGAVDGRGWVTVLGRRDDVIISGGENIAPEAVEACLTSHPAVSEAAVAARPSARWGQRPVAFLVSAAGAVRPTDQELTAYCRAALPAFAVPDAFTWCAALPRDALGKLRRRALVSP